MADIQHIKWQKSTTPAHCDLLLFALYKNKFTYLLAYCIRRVVESVKNRVETNKTVVQRTTNTNAVQV